MGLIISQFKADSIDFRRNIGFNIDYFKKNFNFKDLDSVKEKDVIISSDHSNSYLLLKKFKIDGLIVIDQHIDLYNLEGLNKASVFRRCFEENLVKFIIFVGVRDKEIEEFELEKDLYNIEIIRTDDFNSGVLNALKILKKKGFKDIAIDIDLDAFDSNFIKGVEYCEENLKNVLNDRKKFIEDELNDKGLKVDVNINKLRKFAIENDLNIVYRHITEFEPEFDDGRTLELVKKLI